MPHVRFSARAEEVDVMEEDSCAPSTSGSNAGAYPVSPILHVKSKSLRPSHVIQTSFGQNGDSDYVFDIAIKYGVRRIAYKVFLSCDVLFLECKTFSHVSYVQALCACPTSHSLTVTKNSATMTPQLRNS